MHLSLYGGRMCSYALAWKRGGRLHSPSFVTCPPAPEVVLISKSQRITEWNPYGCIARIDCLLPQLEKSKNQTQEAEGKPDGERSSNIPACVQFATTIPGLNQKAEKASTQSAECRSPRTWLHLHKLYSNNCLLCLGFTGKLELVHNEKLLAN